MGDLMSRRGGPAAARTAARLRELGTLRYWTKRQQRSRRELQRSVRGQRLRGWLEDQQRDLGIAATLAKRSVWPALSAALLVVVCEVLAWVAAYLPGPLGELSRRFEPNSYQTLIGASVTATATFLALFFTTVGVVASTTYRSVPAEIRTLFIEERSSVIYVRGVVRALVFGVLLLLVGAFVRQLSMVSIVVLGMLSLNAVLRLMLLGNKLFNFFDPSTLSQALPARFDRALRRVTTPATASDKANQVIAHHEASQVLRLYRQITVLLSQEQASEPSASRRVANQLLNISARYANAKGSIPTTGDWWGVTPSHPNWLTLDHHRLSMALATSTGVTPALEPDPLWVERGITDALNRLLTSLIRDGHDATAVELADRGSPLVKLLGSRLQIEEALLFAKTFTEAMVYAVDDDKKQPGGGQQVQLNTLAAAERSISSMTDLWLGYVHAVRTLAEDDLASAFDSAVADPARPSEVVLPRPVVVQLAKIAASLEREREAEGQLITPTWWIHHLCAREFARAVLSSYHTLIRGIEPQLTSLIQHQIDEGRFAHAAVMVISARELVSKMRSHHASIDSAFTRLSRLRHAETADESWPEAPDGTAFTQQLDEDLLRQLAACIPHLHEPSHSSDQPDLFGQTYRILVDSTFDAILAGREDVAQQLFRVVFVETDAVRERLRADLNDASGDMKFIWIVEPLVTLVELSGYALLMQELDGAGIWEDVREIWNASIAASATGALAQNIVDIMIGLESTPSAIAGGLARTSRQQRLDHLFAERGIAAPERGLIRSRRAPIPRAHASAIVTAFARERVSLSWDATDLFIAEYLRGHLDADATLPRNTTMLLDQLERIRGEGNPRG